MRGPILSFIAIWGAYMRAITVFLAENWQYLEFVEVSDHVMFQPQSSGSGQPSEGRLEVREIWTFC